MGTTTSAAMDTDDGGVAETSNVVPFDARVEPVIVDYMDASTPKSDIARRIAAEATVQTGRATNAKDKKTGYMRLVSASRGDLFSINPYLIGVKEGWNSRVATAPENMEHVDMLARSIAEVGVKNPMTVALEGDKMYVTDGHCRLLATFRAIEVYGAEIKSVPVTVEGRFASEPDRILSQIVRNSGKTLTVMEQGAVFVKLISFGWTPKQIADKAGLGLVRVTQILDLMATATDGIKEMVTTGKIASSTAALALREAGGDAKEAERVLSDAVEQAESEGKTRATPKHIAGATEHAKKGTRKAKGEKPATKAEAAAAATEATATENAKKVTLKTEMREIFDSKTTEVDTSEESMVTIMMSAADWRRLANLLDI